MPIDDQQQEAIDRYLRGEMTPGERDSFEKEITNDPELGKEIALQRDIVAGIELQYRKRLKARFKQLESSYYSKPYKSRAWAIAASVLIATAIGLTLFFSGNWGAENPEKLYARHFSVYPNYLAEIKRGEKDLTPLQEAMHLYEKKAFEKAIPELKKLEPADENRLLKIRFYLANAYMAEGSEDKAIPLLETIIAYPAHSYYKEALWYQGLAYLKKGNKTKAKATFRQLAELDGTLSNKAVTILNDL